MKKDEFINKAKHRGTTILPSDECDLDMLGEFRSLKSFFQYIDFNCQITKTGCKEMEHTKVCCCHGCMDSLGYFRMIPENNITYYSRKFSVKTGFWREGKGCILPHKMRSTTCLTHHCNHRDHPYFEKDKKYKDFNRGIEIIKQKLFQLRHHTRRDV